MILARLIQWIVLFPVQCALILLFGVTDLLHCLFRRRCPPPVRPPQKAARRICSIVVLNWNGRHLLEESLPRLLEAVSRTGVDHEVLVVDNGSDDGSVDWLAEHFPKVRCLALPENLGFGEGNNRGVEAARHDYVVLLNNDIIVDHDFLNPLLEPFDDPTVFAVSSQIEFPEGVRREETGNTQARFERGYLHLSHDPLQACHFSRESLAVFWAGGGSSAFDRKKFLELDGFCPLFEPCYLEDTDLSYRAWRRGWKVLLSARSRVLHKHRSSTSRRFTRQQLVDMIETRKFWYLWKNFQMGTLLGHMLWLPLHLGGKVRLRSYLKALGKLPLVLRLRMAEPARVVSDGRLRKWCSRPLMFLLDSGRAASRSRQSRLKILIVSAYLPHVGRHGGAGRVFHLLRQAARAHDITLLTFIENEAEAEMIEQVRPYCRSVETVTRRHFQPVSLYPYEPFEEYNSPIMSERLESLLALEDFDLVHFEWTQMGQYAGLTPHLPKVLTEIEVNYAAHLSEVRLIGNPLKKFKRYYDSLQTLRREVQMCRRVDRVVCVTNDDRDYLEGLLPQERVSVINTGVDIHYFGEGNAADVKPDSLLFVGAFRHTPNVDAMIYFCDRVLPLIQKENPRAHLYIVGSSPTDSILDLDKRPGVTVTGFVEDIRPYYHRAQVVVVPLRTGVGIRGKVLEGWACAKAMVATPLSCQGIRAIEDQNIRTGASAPDLAARTLELLSDPERCRRLGRAGRLTAERFYSWEALGKQVCDLYEELVQKSPALKPTYHSGKILDGVVS